MIWAGCWYLALSFSSNLSLSMTCQFMASLGAANVLTLSAGLAQELTPVHLRARIISTFLMIILGLQPFASYLVGRVADMIGLKNTILINGTCMVVFPALLLTVPSLFRLKATVEIPVLRNQAA